MTWASWAFDFGENQWICLKVKEMWLDGVYVKLPWNAVDFFLINFLRSMFHTVCPNRILVEWHRERMVSGSWSVLWRFGDFFRAKRAITGGLAFRCLRHRLSELFSNFTNAVKSEWNYVIWKRIRVPYRTATALTKGCAKGGPSSNEFKNWPVHK